MTSLTRSTRTLLFVFIAFALLLLAGGAVQPVEAPAAPVPSDRMEALSPSPVSFTVVEISNDTLHAAPAVNGILASWNPATPKAFCIVQSAYWRDSGAARGFFYIKQLELAGLPNKVDDLKLIGCDQNQPVLLQLPGCPTNLELGAPAPFIVVQCGPNTFSHYTGSGARAETDNDGASA